MDIQMPNKMVMKLPMKSDSFKMQRIFLIPLLQELWLGIKKSVLKQVWMIIAKTDNSI
jgi:hypothetical protein